MKIQQININKLKEYEYNAKKHDEKQIKNVMQSIKEFGMVQPIVIDQNNTIIIGHCRFRALKRLKWEEVPCVRIENLSENEINKLRLLDNKLNESEWDFDLLSDQIGAIDWNNFDIDWGLDDFFKEDEKSEIIEDEAPDVEDTSISQVGDIYILGKHRLICGDSTDVNVIDKLMNGAKADMVFTDPPYGMNLDTDFSGMQNHRDMAKEKGLTGGKKYEQGKVDEFHPEMIDAVFTIDADEMFLWGADYFAELLPNKNDGSWIVWDKRANGNDDVAEDYSSDKMYGSCFELCWSKKKHKRDIARVKWAGVFGTEQEFDRKRHHPTQKPIKLAGWFLDKYSKEGQNIVDIFGGSGSTLIACEQLNRRCFMCELDEHYVDVIVKRYIDFTNNKDDVYVIRDGQKIKYKDLKA
jgi:DNA modification methylase